MPLLEEIFATRTVDEWLEPLLRRRRSRAAPINDVAAALTEPHTDRPRPGRRDRAPALRHGRARSPRRCASAPSRRRTAARRSATRTSTTSSASCSATTRRRSPSSRAAGAFGRPADDADDRDRGWRRGRSACAVDDVPDDGRGAPPRGTCSTGSARRSRPRAPAPPTPPSPSRPVSAARPRRPCSAAATGSRAPAAALANGTLVHALDFDDTHAGGLVHATAVVLPAVLAVGEQVGADRRRGAGRRGRRLRDRLPDRRRRAARVPRRAACTPRTVVRRLRRRRWSPRG